MESQGTTAEFHNQQAVHVQAGTQNLYGHTYHGPVHFHAETPRRSHDYTGHDADSHFYNQPVLMSLSFPGMLSRRANIDQAHPDTCEWILNHEQYQLWLSDRCNMLWIKGKPGAGKSTLMAFLYAKLQQTHEKDKNININFFFHARGDKLQRTALGMYRSLLNQLFLQEESIRPLVRKAFLEKHVAFGGGPPKWQWEAAELEELLARVISTSAETRQVNILIDALDEAGAHAARMIAKYFLILKNRLSNLARAKLKVCISSRHYPIPTIRPGRELTVEDHNIKDIIRYVNEHLDCQYIEDLDSSSRELWKEMVACVTERAAGIFQWVRLIVLMIESRMEDGESLQSIRRQLDVFPTALGEVYKHILVNIVPQQYWAQSNLLLQWVCLAERPLSTTEMRFAIAVPNLESATNLTSIHQSPDFIPTNEIMRRHIVAISGGLVETVYDLSRKEEVVQVIHQSVNDYLMSAGLALMSDLQVSETRGTAALRQIVRDVVSESHLILFRWCLNLLIREMPEMSRGFFEWQKTYLQRRQWIPIPGCETDHLSSWVCMEYAASYMFTHLDKASERDYLSRSNDVKRLNGVVSRWSSLSQVLIGSSLWKPSPYTLDMAVSSNFADLVRYSRIRKDVRLGYSIDGENLEVTNQRSLSTMITMYVTDTKNVAALDETNNGAEIACNFAFPDGFSPFGYWTSHEAMWNLQKLLNKNPDHGVIATDFIHSGEQIAIYRYPIDTGILGKSSLAKFEEVAFLTFMSSETPDWPILHVIVDKRISPIDTSGSTVLHFAVRHGLGDLVRKAVEAHVDIDMQDYFGRTAIHLAIYGRDTDTIEYLLGRGAKLSITDKYGRTPADWMLLDPYLASRFETQCANTITTPSTVQMQTLRATLRQLRKHICQVANIDIRVNAVSNPTLILGFWEFARCLIHLDDKENAKLVLEKFSHLVSPGPSCFDVCSNCRRQPLRVDGFDICLMCPETIFCLDCVNNSQQPGASVKHDPLCIMGHQMLEIRPTWIDLSKKNLEKVSDWLISLLRRHESGPNQQMLLRLMDLKG